MEEMFTTEPCLASIMWGNTYLLISIAPVRLTAKHRSHSDRSMSTIDSDDVVKVTLSKGRWRAVQSLNRVVWIPVNQVLPFVVFRRCAAIDML